VWFEKKNGIIYGSSSTGGSMPVIKRRSSAGKQHAGGRRKAMYRVTQAMAVMTRAKSGFTANWKRTLTLPLQRR